MQSTGAYKFLKRNIMPREILESVNLPKVCGLRSQAWPMFCLTLRKILESVNLPKACGLKSQAWPRFCLTLRKKSEVLIYLRHVVRGARHGQGSV